MVWFPKVSRNNGNKSKNNGSSSPSGRKLSIETLESRELLAADLAEISGVVRTDLQGDSNASNDTVVVGATATLYRDGGNGVFDINGGDDSVVGASVTTDASGRYRFDQVAAGNYFVNISLPSHLQFRPGEGVKAISISGDEGDGIVGPTIDGFTTFQTVNASPPPVSSDANTLLDSAVLGGERDLHVELLESTNPISSVTLAASGGNLYVASGPGATGNVKIVWDGIDGNARSVNPTGLGGVDLTVDANGNTMTGISLTSGADHPNAVIKMRIYSDANNWSEFTTIVPESVGGEVAGQAVFNFADAATAQSGQGANFANVGALELTFEGVKAVDAQVSLVGLVGRATKQADFTASPRLSLGDEVWYDIDDDGLLENGEKPIAGVKLNLYEDTNLDNQYTAGIDQLLGQEKTDTNGKYLFTDLFPGKYIVQVDPTCFQTTGPLTGLHSSLGDAVAADPDNDVDNDDNGTPLAGAGVVSQAIMLVGDSEPTNDGDSNSNSNRSVDFGFFGFDLVLDKSVQQTIIAPNDTLNYSIKIDNVGPSEAAGTTFKDELPDFANYVSGTTSIPGVTLQHNNGIVTADLGTLQPGATVTVTIVAAVDAAAFGTLVNNASVSAPKEVNLTNNTDSVSNPLTPHIDLAIDKSADRTTIKTGESLSYTLDIVNNGPSDATGVIITDMLPETGITFVSASQTPSSQSGRELTFDVGNLARGATASVTINVLVDSGFSGILLNEANVKGNEVETTYLNNDDFVSIPVTPLIDLAIDKSANRDTLKPGESFSYTLDIVNNGPSDATGVVIADTLPASGITFVSASQTPASQAGRELTFNVGNLADGETASVTVNVLVDKDFAGTLLNQANVKGNEEETTYANNEDSVVIPVQVEPASLAGAVFVDRNDNGVFDSGEQPIGNVIVTLQGIDYNNQTVTRTTTTAADGSYLFDNLDPGNYRVLESHPDRYKDGKDHIGSNGGNRGIDPGPNLIPNGLSTQQVDDLFLGIELEGGDAAIRYDFGELADSVSKIDFIRSYNWR